MKGPLCRNIKKSVLGIPFATSYVRPEKANFPKIYSRTEIADICLYWRLKRFLGKGMKRDYWGVIEFYINVVIKVAEKLFISLNNVQ